MVKAVLVLALLGGCFDDRYRCTSDAQCDVGEGGRCELDGFCTKFDSDCTTGRRYQHAGEHGDACFDDRIAPRNACAGGQQPAMPEPSGGCFADVCARLPACCDVAWTDACVQVAQEVCTDLRCDTRIAITASRGTLTELWDVRWTGAGWAPPDKRTEYAQPLAWVAPAPGDSEPRLAGTSGNNALVVGNLRFPTEANRVYTSITTINFDRDRRDTIVVGHQGLGGGDQTIDVIKGDGTQRTTSTVQTAQGLTWGDIDRDNFVDAITRTAVQYHYLPSFDGAGHARDVTTRTIVNGLGGTTDPAPGMRSVDWLDFDGDKKLDLVAFGSDVHVHTDPNELRENPEYRVDCNPPSAATPLPCTPPAPEPNFEAMAFGGAALPSKDGAKIVISTFPGRKLLLGTLDDKAVLQLRDLPFPGSSCSCTFLAGQMRWDCTGCLQIIAVVVRDLDGDHALDIVAIDARLNLYHAFAKTGFQFVGPTVINTALGNPEGFISINVSISGATL